MPDHHDPDEWVSRHYPIQEDLSVQKRIWIVERAGWYVLCVIVLFTLLGKLRKSPGRSGEMPPLLNPSAAV